MLSGIKENVRKWKNRRQWRKRNPRNYTTAETSFRMVNLSVGDYTYGPLNIDHYYLPAKLTIGRYCSIAKDVRFMLGGNHGTKSITTYPFGPRVYGTKFGGTLKWKVDIVVEDDVWIGQGALVLPGVTIGRGCIIGARSVVTKDVPPYSVYAGTRIVRKRFSDQIIERLMLLDYRTINHTQWDEFADLWDEDLTEENMERIIAAFQGGK